MDVLIVTRKSEHQFIDRTLVKKSHTARPTTPVRVTLEFDTILFVDEVGILGCPNDLNHVKNR